MAVLPSCIHCIHCVRYRLVYPFTLPTLLFHFPRPYRIPRDIPSLIAAVMFAGAHVPTICGVVSRKIPPRLMPEANKVSHFPRIVYDWFETYLSLYLRCFVVDGWCRLLP